MAGVGVVRRLAMLAAAWVVCGIVLEGAAPAQGQDDLARLLAEARRLHGEGRYAAALPMAERAVELARERYGEAHTEFASAINWLGKVYHSQGRFPEAEPLLRRSLAIREKALAPNHPDVGMALHNLGALYREGGRFAEAEPLLKRSLAVSEKALGPEHPRPGR